MSHARLDIDPDIRRARTPPSALYHDPQWFQRIGERILARTWHANPDPPLPACAPGTAVPWNLLPGALDEPLLLTTEEDGTRHLLSNVCTHRGATLIERPCEGLKALRCPYHGRRFGLDGRFVSMPRFEGAQDFPGPSDSLPRVQMGQWAGLTFASLDPAHPLEALVGPMDQRLSFLPVASAQLSPAHCRDYHVPANWALYCDNYLEGFHIPYVHPTLNRALDFEGYETQTFALGSVQLGRASEGAPCFAPPKSHPDHEGRVAGYYFWLLPTTMVNAYPWGLSINLVLPLSPTRTRVVFLTYIWDGSLHDRGAGAGLEQVEYEDEAIVERCQRGVRSRLYDRGRYSPQQEVGTHHFHRLLASMLAQ